MRQYVVIFERTVGELVQGVQKHIGEGGKLVGGIAFCGNGFVQALLMPVGWQAK